MSGHSSNTNGHSKDPRTSKGDLQSDFIAPIIQKSNSWVARNKSLSPEFNNIKDEAELGKLMGDEGEKLLTLIDDLRKIDSLRNEELDIPQIVVIGDTSSGKSSVLQALTRLPFPVAGLLCTRFVTETTIRRCGPFERPGYKIEVKMDGCDASEPLPFEPKIFEHDEWVQVYQNLRVEIQDAFDQMSPAHLLPPNVPTTTMKAENNIESMGSTTQLLKHVLQITVRKSNQAHFSVVDVPGFISNGAAVDIQLSVDLARQFIAKKQAIVLAITPANNVIVNQNWLNLVTKEGALDRTIGVITKTDRIETADHEPIFSLLRNRADSPYRLKLGWFAVRNRSSEEIEHGESFEERDRKENEFFRAGKWKEATSDFPILGSVDPNVLGIQRLKLTLQGHLYKQVKESLPDLRKNMRILEAVYNGKIQRMGLPRDKSRDQRVYLSEIQEKYEKEVQRSLNGDYRVTDKDHPSRLRYRANKLNDEFESAIQFNAAEYKWEFRDHDDDDKGILTWIDNTWDAHRGSEPRLDTPGSLKKELVKQQTKSWEVTTKAYIQRVEDSIQACNKILFQFACEDDTLRFKIRSKLEAREAKAFEDARAELQQILKDRDYIDSWNPQLAIFIAEGQRPRIERQVKLQLAQQKRASTPEADALEASVDQVAARELFYLNNKKVYEVHDWLFAYWKVAYPRFVDNVIIQVVERHLLGPGGPLRLFDRKWIFDLEDEELEELVGENEKTRADRKDLKERLDGLKIALEKTDAVLHSSS